jgi:YVTN family beta-propeller protein
MMSELQARFRKHTMNRSAWLALAVCGCIALPALAVQPPATELPTGQRITPLAAAGSRMSVLDPGLPSGVKPGFAQAAALSPDGTTLLVLTAGYDRVVDQRNKRVAAESTQFVFVYDVSHGAPLQRQVLPVSAGWDGLAFAPDGRHFYVPGASEDALHIFSLGDGGWSEEGKPVHLGHHGANGLDLKPVAANVGITPDGTRALVVNRFNDSVSVVDLATRKVSAELDLRPGKNGAAPGTPGGQYPSAVAIAANGLAYVSSELDREIVVVDLNGDKPAVKARIAVQGSPNKLVLNRAGTRLYAASDFADVVSVIDTATGQVVSTVPTLAPSWLLTPAQARYKGASPNALALSPDEKTLYVTNRGSNSLAVIGLDGAVPAVRALLPTGWAPTDVRVSGDGRMLYVVNAKSVPGPNTGNCRDKTSEHGKCRIPGSPVHFRPNDYVLSLTNASLLSMPVQGADAARWLTRQVARNNDFDRLPTAAQANTIAELRSKIHHIIYVIKENRTYDQVLGDLGKGNGDASLTEFPYATTPNSHELAKRFVTLDNFYDSGDVSGNGWQWSVAARESDAGFKTIPPGYAGGGGTYDWEGANRNVNVALTGQARVAANPQSARLDPDTLPAASNVAAPDGPDGEVQQGYLWNAALRAGLTVRNYGMYVDLTRYWLDETADSDLAIRPQRDPFATGTQVGFAAHPALLPVTDPYFYGFDNRVPDFYRFKEWEREFKGFAAEGIMPNLSLVRFMNDHTGHFNGALDGVDTPDRQVADNDYALGLLVDAVAHSPFANDTLIFVLEDDAQDGADHVDAHRGPCWVIGPYVKKGAVVSTRYSTVSVLRTITDILGMDHLGMYDASQAPMTDVFDVSPSNATWTYSASASSLLKPTALPFPEHTVFGPKARSPHDAAYWAAVTKGFDFTQEDRLDADKYNRILWAGLKANKPYPARAKRTTVRTRDADD